MTLPIKQHLEPYTLGVRQHELGGSIHKQKKIIKDTINYSH